MNYKLNVMELKILDCIFQGKHNLEISEILGISMSETSAHVDKLYKKFGVSNRLQIILKYYL